MCLKSSDLIINLCRNGGSNKSNINTVCCRRMRSAKAHKKRYQNGRVVRAAASEPREARRFDTWKLPPVNTAVKSWYFTTIVVGESWTEGEGEEMGNALA